MADARFGLPDRCCLVTGGTKGIGKEVVEELGGLGAKVFTCARTEKDLTEVLERWRSSGLDVQGCIADVSDEESRQNLMEKVKSAFDGRLDILVNNVGYNIRKTTLEYTSEDFDALMSTNIKSAFALCQLCHPMLKLSEHASIVFLSSAVAAARASNTGVLYSMSKAAMNQITKNLACEWAKDGIRVNAVSPWYIKTELANQVLSKPGYSESVCKETPMNRVGEPNEISGVVAFFCSKAATFITGQNLNVDGGYSVRGLNY
ncbi:hypothetical protein BSKO_02927 [Bryopsis sp. KO-2023]|nr:hypothetical protein BSKO_02927 [Bryopsis sp. KO-2023]